MMRKRADQCNSKKQKLYTEPNQNVFHKENFLFNSDGSEKQHESYKSDVYNGGREALKVIGSTAVSPTFQSLSVKDEIYREGAPLTIGFSLRDLEKTNIEERNKGLERQILKLHEKHKTLQQQNRKLNQKCNYYEQKKQVNDTRKKVSQNYIHQNEQKNKSQDDEQKQQIFTWAKLQEHYKAKDYWQRLQKMLKQQGKDIRLMRQLQLVTTQNKKQRAKRKKKEEQIAILKQQIQKIKAQKAQNKHFQQFQKRQRFEQQLNQLHQQYECLKNNFKKQQNQIQALTNANKMQLKQLKDNRQQLQIEKLKYKENEMKYKQLKLLHQQVQRKRKELTKQLDCTKRQLDNSKRQNNQANKKINKSIEQIKKQFQFQKNQLESQYKNSHKQLLQNCNKIILNKQQSLRVEKEKEIEEIKVTYQNKIKELQIAMKQAGKRNLQKLKEDIENKNMEKIERLKKQCQEMKRRQEESTQRESRASGEVDKLFTLLDEAEKNKILGELQLSKLKKNQIIFKQKIKGQDQCIQETTNKCIQLTNKLKQKQERVAQMEKQIIQKDQQDKEKETIINKLQKQFQFQSENRIKKRVDRSGNSMQKQFEKGFLKKINQCLQIVQRLSNEINISSKHINYGSNELNQEYCMGQLICEIQQFDNKCRYVLKENDILSKKLNTLTQIRDGQRSSYQKELSIKEDALKTTTAFIPDQHKDIVLEFLCFTQQISVNQQQEGEKYHSLKQKVREEAKAWKQFVRKLQKKNSILEEQNQEFRRRSKARGKDQDGNVKKEIRKRYDL